MLLKKGMWYDRGCFMAFFKMFMALQKGDIAQEEGFMAPLGVHDTINWVYSTEGFMTCLKGFMTLQKVDLT